MGKKPYEKSLFVEIEDQGCGRVSFFCKTPELADKLLAIRSQMNKFKEASK